MGEERWPPPGLITLLRTLPTIFSALKAGLKVCARRCKAVRGTSASIATCPCAGSFWFHPHHCDDVDSVTFHPIQGAETRWYHIYSPAFFVTVFGFLFVTVARDQCLLGNSSKSDQWYEHRYADGHTARSFSSLLDRPNYQVCPHDWRRRLHCRRDRGRYFTGFEDRLPGRRHTLLAADGLLVGVTVSHAGHRTTLNLMNKGLEKYIPTPIPVAVQALPVGVKVERDTFTYHGKNYELLNALGSHEIPDGEYLYDPGSKQIEYQWAQGIGSAKAPPRRHG